MDESLQQQKNSFVFLFYKYTGVYYYIVMPLPKTTENCFIDMKMYLYLINNQTLYTFYVYLL